MKNCELCKSAARVFCDSDQASLCWDCDSKVHTANFLVAKHSRNLLCHACQSPTAWNASGPKLGKTVSVCEGCVDGCGGVKESRDRCGDSEEGYDRDVDTETDVSGDEDDDDCESDNEIDFEDEDEDDDDDEDEDDDIEDDEDGDNQVVPGSSTPPPPAASSSSDDDYLNSIRRDNRFSSTTVDLGDEGEREFTSRRNNTSPVEDSVDSSRPLKRRKINEAQCDPISSRTAAIVESIEKFDDLGFTSGNKASATIAEICKLSNDPAADD